MKSTSHAANSEGEEVALVCSELKKTNMLKNGQKSDLMPFRIGASALR